MLTRKPLALAVVTIGSLLVSACTSSDGPALDEEHARSSTWAFRHIPTPNDKPPPPSRPPWPPTPPSDPSNPLYVSDVGSLANIYADEATFWQTWFAGEDAATTDEINKEFAEGNPQLWYWGAAAAALVQMYDLMAPLNSAAAMKYLQRLGVIGEAFLAQRDDNRDAPIDPFRGTVMAAWGGYAKDRDGKWNTDVVTAGLFTYAMSAYARRVADDPQSFTADERLRAVRFVNATMRTYVSFRGEMHLTDADPDAYYALPDSYADLLCCVTISSATVCPLIDPADDHSCKNYRAGAGETISWNENFSMMIGLTEFALAADSVFFRSTTDDSLVNALSLFYATKEVPRLVAKNFAFFFRNLKTKFWSDGAPYYEWNHQYFGAPRIQDTTHGSFELASIAVLYAQQDRLNAILAKESFSERLIISPASMKPFATTFLRLIWRYDANNLSMSNVLAENIDGTGEVSQYSDTNADCAGFLPLTQFDPWVWTRCRDTTFHWPIWLRVQNHAALLRYRARSPGIPPRALEKGKFLGLSRDEGTPVFAYGQ